MVVAHPPPNFRGGDLNDWGDPEQKIKFGGGELNLRDYLKF